jgi:hypothetical protein
VTWRPEVVSPALIQPTANQFITVITWEINHKINLIHKHTRIIHSKANSLTENSIIK